MVNKSKNEIYFGKKFSLNIHKNSQHMQNYENIGPKAKVKNVCIRNIWSVKM